MLAGSTKDTGPDAWAAALAALCSLADAAVAGGAPPPAKAASLLCRQAARLSAAFPATSFLHVEAREVLPLLELPEPLIAHVVSHLATIGDMASFGCLCTATAAALGHACEVRAERRGSRLPALLAAERPLDALRFVEALCAQPPTTIAAGSAHTLATAPGGGAWSCGGDSLGERGFLGHLGHGAPHAPPRPLPAGTRPRRVHATSRRRAVRRASLLPAPRRAGGRRARGGCVRGGGARGGGARLRLAPPHRRRRRLLLGLERGRPSRAQGRPRRRGRGRGGAAQERAPPAAAPARRPRRCGRRARLVRRAARPRPLPRRRRLLVARRPNSRRRVETSGGRV